VLDCFSFKKTQALAANFLGASINLLWHSSEQKKTGSPLLLCSAIASPSARCIPHTGSRTNFLDTASLGASMGCSLPLAAAPILFTSRRSRETLHETINTQNRNRRMRAINVIRFRGATEGSRHVLPIRSVEPSVCRPFRGVKRKAVDSRSCVACGMGEPTHFCAWQWCKYGKFSRLAQGSCRQAGTAILAREFGQFPYTASALQVLRSNHPPVGNSLQSQSRCGPRPVPTRSACAQIQFSHRPWA
jgi:hypothetical protein